MVCVHVVLLAELGHGLRDFGLDDGVDAADLVADLPGHLEDQREARGHRGALPCM
jgi:hypothetical protein